MKILYAIQGTGNGHFSRAKEFIPHLLKFGELDVLVSGSSVDVELGHDIAYRKTGISYTFGRNGGIDYLDTALKLSPTDFLNDVMGFPIEQYDVIINDYEPVTAWAAKKSGVSVVGMSHQSAFLSAKTPRPPESNLAAEWLFKYYAPCTTPIGFHYLPYDDFIFTPIIRSEVRALKPSNKGHITVYLPAYADETLLSIFHRFPSISWHLFSKHAKTAYISENVSVWPVNNQKYLQSLENALGVISGGGFEAPSECLYLGKKLLVVPMKDQYEQKCNAEALRRVGIPIVPEITSGFVNDIEKWLDTPQQVELEFPNRSAEIVQTAIEKSLAEVALSN